MPITIQCPHCDKIIDGVSSKYRGQVAKCLHCNGRIPIDECEVGKLIDDKPLSPPSREPTGKEDLKPYEAAADSIASSGIVAGLLVMAFMAMQLTVVAQQVGVKGQELPIYFIFGAMLGLIPCWFCIAFGNAIAAIIRLLAKIVRSSEVKR